MAPPESAEEVRSEGLQPRWSREAKERILSLPFVLAEAVGTVVSGAIWGWEGALIFLAGLLVVVLVVSLFVTPVFQRDEARAELGDPELPNFPIDVEISREVEVGEEAAPDVVVLPAIGPGEVIVALGFVNHHAEDVPILGAVVNFDVPYEFGLEKVWQDGSPMPMGDILTVGTERRFWVGENAHALVGGGGTSLSHFKLTVPQPGEFVLIGKLRISGFAWIDEPFILKAVRAPQLALEAQSSYEEDQP
jgi:hypothetical protein